jgi:hypothetical protein
MKNTSKKVSTFIAAAGFAATLLVSSAPQAFAVDFSKVKVSVSNDINNDCLVSKAFDPIWSCFTNKYEKVAGHEALVPTPTIYLRPDVPAPLLPYVFMTSIGQYLAMPYSDQELARVFNPAPNQEGFQDVRRAAATNFAFWALGGKLTPAKVSFFAEALAR